MTRWMKALLSVSVVSAFGLTEGQAHAFYNYVVCAEAGIQKSPPSTTSWYSSYCNMENLVNDGGWHELDFPLPMFAYNASKTGGNFIDSVTSVTVGATCTNSVTNGGVAAQALILYQDGTLYSATSVQYCPSASSPAWNSLSFTPSNLGVGDQENAFVATWAGYEGTINTVWAAMLDDTQH
jgi:hypothetical protein